MAVNPSPSVFRAAEILEWIASRGGESQSLAEIVRGTAISKATCHAFVLALSSAGFLVRDEGSQRYRLGPLLLMLGKAVSDDYRVAEQAQTVCRALAADIGRPVLTAVSTGARVVIVSTTASLRTVGIPLMVGQSVPLAPPMGAVFVAWRSDAVVAGWLDQLPDLDTETRATLTESLRLVRQFGYCVTFEGGDDSSNLAARIDVLTAESGGRPAQLYRVTHEMARAGYLPVAVDRADSYRLLQIAAPIFDPAGVVDLALVVPSGMDRLGGAEVLDLAERVKAAADEVTRDRGGEVPVGPSVIVSTTA